MYEYKEKLFITYESLNDNIKNFDLSKFILENNNEELIITKNNTIYIDKDLITKYYNKEVDLKYFQLKGFPNDGEIKKFKDLDLSKEHIYQNAKEYSSDLKKIKPILNKIAISKKTIKLFENFEESFFNKKIICFDIEAYELEQSKITEIGFSILENYNLETKHFIIKENYDLRNGKYVEDNKDNFLFGKSELKSLEDTILILKENCDKSDIILGHGLTNDFKYLSKNSKLFHNHNYTLIDTEKLSKLLDPNGMGVKKILKHFDIEFKNLHNAGNDAYFNLKFAAQLFKEFDISNYKKEIENLKIHLKSLRKDFDEKWKDSNDLNNFEKSLN